MLGCGRLQARKSIGREEKALTERYSQATGARCSSSLADGSASAGMPACCRAFSGEGFTPQRPSRPGTFYRRALAFAHRRRVQAWQLLSQCISPIMGTMRVVIRCTSAVDDTPKLFIARYTSEMILIISGSSPVIASSGNAYNNANSFMKFRISSTAARLKTAQ